MAEEFDILTVIDRLEVGPVRLEPQRLTVPYRVIRGSEEDTRDLIYRFEENVFTPDDLSALNLAAMMGAQVALNYGLFCKEIAFYGPYDEADRKFLLDMAQNTAREIFVKKFLESNPFIVGPAKELSAVKLKSYLQAQLIFPEEARKELPGSKKSAAWNGSYSKHAVLSSGGKDSLLSFGLLRDAGCEVHPIFVNESGRHWFTALNAYRYFSATIPNTARVWTNADRIFNWMLRHLPFVRQDFAQVRADIYPVRLWTVAVFLFGALPLLRKRGIGRLVIGDEYDTTRRTFSQGITHYDGLYDQSRYFDNALTRYFNRKGWGVSQFSLLRPLSELLIEKILVERYPELQQHQISCHAAHKEGERIKPCGRCEKCRRIVAMVSAIGADPKLCGYTEEQITFCLKQLADKGVNQEGESVRHLLYLLQKEGLLDEGISLSGKAKSSDEEMKLKFDNERSPFESIPPDLRKPVYSQCLKHAEGSLKRNGRLWMDIDLMKEEDFKQPYPFEARPAGPGKKEKVEGEAPGSSSNHELAKLTWPEARKRFREVDVALLPVGAIEQHGPHLPLDTDAFDAEYLALKVGDRCTDPKPLVLPLIPYGVSYHHDDFSGTISVSPGTLSQLVIDVGRSIARYGITKLVIINGHGGNTPALNYAAQVINRDAHIFTCVDTGESSDTDLEALAETPNDVHAGEIETSTSMAVRPDEVRTEAMRKFVPRFSSRYLNFSSKRGVNWYAYTSKISTTGVMGDPTKATREKGEQMWELMIRHLVEFVEDLKRMSLDELYQKRY